MKRIYDLRYEFVSLIPDPLEPGKLYISTEYATASHLCCCGCGFEVVTPLSPTDWRIIFDGESVSLEPSIGNWSFPCQSHYWIRGNRVRWAERWTSEQIAAGRDHDRRTKRAYFGEEEPHLAGPQAEQRNLVSRVWRRFRRMRAK